MEAQTACEETLELVKACRRTLAGEGTNNRSGEPAEDSRGGSKDYRLSPADGVLERQAVVTRALIWVPVMPTTKIPLDHFEKETEVVTWRRFAFLRAHETFFEPHRNPDSTWQALKRMASWGTMHKDFNIWINYLSLIHI